MNKEKLFQYFFGCKSDIFPETVIVTPFIPMKKFEEHCEAEEYFKGRLYNGIIVSSNRQKFAVIRCGMGDRFMGDAIVLLAQTAVSKIIFTGSCGGLNDCNVGDLVICENAFNGEGFSRYYEDNFNFKNVLNTGELVPAERSYVDDFKRFLIGKISDEIILQTGDIFTIGSLMAEDRRNLFDIADKGFKGIDLELSAVYKAAWTINCKITALLFVSDLPLSKPIWEELEREESDSYNTGFRELIRLSTEFAGT